MRRYRSLLAIVLVLAAALMAGHGEEPKKQNELMRRKLESSQQVLEGLAVADYTLIGKHAEELLFISKQASFKALDTPAYELHSNQFRRSAETLIENARAKNLDAAALTYVEMTLTCVKCHKHVRDTRMSLRD